MSDTLLFIIAGLGGLFLIMLLIFVVRSKTPDRTPATAKSGSSIGKTQKKGKDRNILLKEASKKLAKNPRDPESLATLADIYYEDQEWEKAFRAYSIILNTDKPNVPGHSIYDIYTKHGVCSMHLKQFNKAYKSFTLAKGSPTEIFEVNSNMGILEYKKKEYIKAAGLLAKARTDRPQHTDSQKYFGLCMMKLTKWTQAVEALNSAYNLDAADKETQYNLGVAYSNLNEHEKALSRLTPLRTDPLFGPNASLCAGFINSNIKKQDSAIEDYTLGLKHEKITPDIAKELHYRLAALLIAKGDIPAALKHLRQVSLLDGNFKDIKALLSKYEDLSGNQNMMDFMIGEVSSFVALCKKLSSAYYTKSNVKIVNVNMDNSEYADVLAEVSTSKWDSLVIFRFIRNKGNISDVVIRDLYELMKEQKAGRGLILTPGSVTEGGKQFVEARLIDIVEGSKFKRILESV